MSQEICNVTYKLINDFIRDINFCFTEMCDITLEECEKLTREQVDEKIQAMNFLDDTVRMRIVGILKDRYYLEDMKKMEKDPSFAEKNHLKIVPISGLVISKICRLENECKSVLDLWEPVRIPKNSEDLRTPLENAVIKQDLKQLDSILKGGLAYINDQDINGWTALHLSCSYCFNSHRFPVTDYLLDCEEIDVTVTNNIGNTPVHYFARMPISDDIVPKYRDVLHKMLKNNNVVHCENCKGETPLHLASYAANVFAVRYLLECGADPNCKAK